MFNQVFLILVLLISTTKTVLSQNIAKSAPVQKSQQQNYENLIVKIGGTVIVKEGSFKVQLVGDKGVKSAISIRGDANNLIIEYNQPVEGNKKIKVLVSLPQLNEIAVHNGGEVYVQSKALSKTFRVSTTNGGNIYSEKEASVESLYSKIEGGGNVKLLNIQSDSAFAYLSGGGYMELSVSEFLNGKILQGGQIIYQGKPVVISDVKGTGEIKPK